MTPSVLRPRRTPSGTVWTVQAGVDTYRIRTASARDALACARRQGARAPTIVGLETNAPSLAANPTAGVLDGRHERIRRAIVPEAVRRRASGESVTAIARALGVARETLRDWLHLAAA